MYCLFVYMITIINVQHNYCGIWCVSSCGELITEKVIGRLIIIYKDLHNYTCVYEAICVL